MIGTRVGEQRLQLLDRHGAESHSGVLRHQHSRVDGEVGREERQRLVSGAQVPTPRADLFLRIISGQDGTQNSRRGFQVHEPTHAVSQWIQVGCVVVHDSG